jgi:NADP-dependent 3-hydroxy acid dehydrogenase YdfG
MLDGEAIARAVVWAVTQPRSTSIDVIQVNPEE